MGAINHGVPKNLCLYLKHLASINNFIETGTYLGDTAKWSSAYFVNSYSIEKSQVMYEKAVSKHKGSKVNFILGDTREKLPQILSTLNDRTIFWLDAHWSGGYTYGEKDECPLLEELLLIIKRINFEDLFILIDDARLFLAPPPSPHNAGGWPNIQEIVGLFDKNKCFIIIHDDVLIIVPILYKIKLIKFIQNEVTNSNLWMNQVKGMLFQDSKLFMSLIKGMVNNIKTSKKD